jgi:hypothetical protein
MKNVLRIILGLLTIAVLGLCGALIFTRSDSPHAGTIVVPTTQQATTPAAKAAPKVSLPVGKVSIGEGTWEVGSEIKPGTYTSTAKEYCYWARMKSTDAESIDSILANGNLNTGAHGRITVKKTDKFVEFSGDCVWTSVK